MKNIFRMESTAKLMEFSDIEIIERTLGGEPEAFNLLVRRWERQIYSLALRMLGRDEEARDVCQDTFLSAFRNLSKFRGDAKFSSWLYRIALNCCHMQLRHRGAGDLSLEQQLEEQGIEPAMTIEQVDESMERRQIADQVKRALMGLPPEMREVIIMKEYQELKFREIAEILSIPLSTVKTRIYAGLNQLKQRLSHLQDQNKLGARRRILRKPAGGAPVNKWLKSSSHAKTYSKKLSNSLHKVNFG